MTTNNIETRYKIYAASASNNETVELPETDTFNIHYSKEQAMADASTWADKCNSERFRNASDWTPGVTLIGHGTLG